MQPIRTIWPVIAASILVILTAAVLFTFGHNGGTSAAMSAANSPLTISGGLPLNLPTPEPPSNWKELAWEALADALTQMPPIEDRGIPVTPEWVDGSFYIDGILYQSPDTLVVRGHRLGGTCVVGAGACVPGQYYVFGPVDDSAPFEFLVESKTGKVWPNRSLSMAEQAAILTKHTDFIATLPGPVVQPAPPDWPPYDPNKPTATPIAGSGE